MNKVLIVEDDTLLNTTLAYHMQGRGMETDSAFGCMDARKKLEARSYDLVILDVNLPDGDGFSLCRQIRRDSYEDEELHIGLQSMTASFRGRDIAFTPLEYRLLTIFIHNPGIVLTRQKLLERLWDDQGNYVDEHTLTTVISRMRSKLEGAHPYIKTVYGMGYLWNGKGGRYDG